MRCAHGWTACQKKLNYIVHLCSSYVYCTARCNAGRRQLHRQRIRACPAIAAQQRRLNHTETRAGARELDCELGYGHNAPESVYRSLLSSAVFNHTGIEARDKLGQKLGCRHSAPERARRSLLGNARLRHGDEPVAAAQITPDRFQVSGCQRLAHARGRCLHAGREGLEASSTSWHSKFSSGHLALQHVPAIAGVLHNL